MYQKQNVWSVNTKRFYSIRKYLQRKSYTFNHVIVLHSKILNSKFTPLSRAQSTYLRYMLQLIMTTAQNTEISSNFLMWKFYWNAQFPYGFGWLVRNSVETVHFHIISTPENLVKFRYFLNLNRKGKITNGRQCVVESTKQERTWELWRSCSISEGFLIRRAILTLIRRVYPS